MKTGRRQLLMGGGLAMCLLVVPALSALCQDEYYELVRSWGSEGSGYRQFVRPAGVAWSPYSAYEYVYVADTGNHRIQRCSPGGAFTGRWGTRGMGNGQFENPRDVAVGPEGRVYVADMDNHRIQKFRANGRFLTKWGSKGTAKEEFYHPAGVATNAAGNVYVADNGNHRIQKFTSSGEFLTMWGTYGEGNGQFGNPQDVAVTALGEVYVVDTGNQRIQKFRANGGFLTKWGSWGSGDGQFQYPRGVAVDASGNVYVADQYNTRIQKFTPDGTLITKWDCYDEPMGVAVDALGNVYVAAWDRHRIHKYARAKPRPDMRARLSWSDPWKFNDVYGDAGTQTLSASVAEGETKLYDLSIQNDTPVIPDTFRIYGRGFSGRWRIRYFSGVGPSEDADITDEVTSGGWVSDVHGGRITATITAPDVAEGGSRRSSAIRAVSEYDGETMDAIQIILRVRTSCQPDAMIKLPGEKGSSGNNIYNTTGHRQSRERLVAKGKKAIYLLGIQNDGNVTETFDISGRGSDEKWRVRYFDARTGGTDITSQVAGVGWQTPELNRSKGQVMRLEITPKRAAVGGDSMVVLVTATSGTKRRKQDAVKALTIVKSTSAAGACQVTSLSALPARAGVQVTFALSSAAQVQARILNIAGRPVKTLCRAKDCEAGTNTLLWNAQSESGLPVPNGTYLVEVIAKAEDGSQARGLQQVRVSR